MGIYNNYLNTSPVLVPAKSLDIYGSSFMVLLAISHWLYGEGAPLLVNINSLNADLNFDDFKDLWRMIENPGYGPGIYSIDMHIEINLFNHGLKNLWAAGLLGRVGGQLMGILELTKDGKYIFNGEYTFNRDKFDADPSNRSYMGEKLTDLLRMIGMLGSKDYEIYFEGSQKIILIGERTVIKKMQPPIPPIFIRSTGGLNRLRS